MNTSVLMQTRSRKTISLTALIDVVFILLMFFMLTSTFTKWHSLELHTSLEGQATAPSNTNIQLIIVRETKGFSLLNNNDNREEQTFSTLTELINKINIDESAVVIPEQQTDVQAIMDAIAQLKKSSVTQVTLGDVLKSN